MYEFRYLLDRFWVTRGGDKELYFTVKRALPQYRRFLNEQLGWNLVVNEAGSSWKSRRQGHGVDGHRGISGYAGLLPFVRHCCFYRPIWDGGQFLLSP
jgi:hypothetical protein